jgi:hypothetical protein
VSADGPDEVLLRALAPVLADVRAAGLAVPRVEADHWTGEADRPSAMLWDLDGSGRGVAVDRHAQEVERVVEAADAVQEFVVEGELWTRGATNWPRCPHHPVNHPLEPRAVDDRAVWVCPLGGGVVAAVGGLDEDAARPSG